MKILSKFYFQDIQFKYKFIIMNLILVLVPTIVLATVLYTNLSSIITSNAIDSEAALVSQTAETLNENVNRLDIAANSISAKRMMTILTYTDDMMRYLEYASTRVDAAELFAEANTLVDGDYITAVRVYLPDNELTGLDQAEVDGLYPNNDILDVESNIQSSYWHGIFDGMPEITSLLCPEVYLTKYEKEHFGNTAFIRKFKNNNYSEQLDIYVAVYINKDYLSDLLKHNLTGNGSVYYVINERNESVASSDLVLSGMYRMRYEDIPTKISEEGKFSNGNILDTSVFLSYIDIGATGWRMVSVIPESNVTKSGASVLRKIVYLYVVFLILAFATALGLSANIAGRLSKIVGRMNDQKMTQTPEKITNEGGKDEIGQLVDNYNEMIDRINNLMEEQTIIAEKLKVSEVNALQAQINPHFLYNMLDMINWLSKAGKTAQASKAITTLSSFYKLTLSKKEIFTTIGEEIRHVGLYSELQNMRYEDKIDMLIDVPEEMYDIKIPKLVFQPIVENAIIHGIFELESKSGSIVLTGWMEGDDAVFTVSDTGVGIEPEKLPLILKGEAEGSGNNIGIYNTHQRLQLVYGDGYGLHFESTLGSGTEVEVRIRREV